MFVVASFRFSWLRREVDYARALLWLSGSSSHRAAPAIIPNLMRNKLLSIYSAKPFRAVHRDSLATAASGGCADQRLNSSLIMFPLIDPYPRTSLRRTLGSVCIIV